MLSTNVKNTSDLMSIALQAEREAIRRYTELSENMKRANNESAAELFQRLIIEEQEHEHLLLAWMSKKNIVENPDIPPVSWRDPNIPTTYDNEARDPSYSTPYRALAFAVHNEEIAFRYYTHVAANSSNNEIREYAETLAREELAHAALLRAERRRAFHDERMADLKEPRLSSKDIHNEVDLFTFAAHTGEYILGKLQQLDFDSKQTPELCSQLEQLNRENEQKIISLTQQSTSPNELLTSTLHQLDLFNDHILAKQKTDDAVLLRILEMCDHEFSFYDSIVETTKDENILLVAQALSSTALNHIDAVKQLLASRNIKTD